MGDDRGTLVYSAVIKLVVDKIATVCELDVKCFELASARKNAI